MVRWTMLCIAACWLALSAASGWGAENCKVCHRVVLTGSHAALPCLSCHERESGTLADPAARAIRARGCVGCHAGYARIFDQAMGTRLKERLFVERSVGRFNAGFFENRCGSCHLTGCADCHGGSGHQLARPRDRDCFACHRGYFVGTDYYGMAPREDSLRYRRGEKAYGQQFLKMTPDVHAEAGLSCGTCHGMASLIAGAKSSKGCRDCHRVSQRVVEHRIAAHLEKLECYACHAAWAAQEYGTFYLRFTESASQEDYEVAENAGGWVKSAYLRKQDAPPLGLNAAGRVSPIRPQFQLYYSELLYDRPVGNWSSQGADIMENRLLAAEWKAFFPHTVRRGTVMCEGCHDNPRRYLMEPPEDRIYQLQADGMTLGSFWDRSGQRVVNGDFLPPARYRAVTARTPNYQRAYLEKWQGLIKHVEGSSAP